jgi:hypothetical protein
VATRYETRRDKEGNEEREEALGVKLAYGLESPVGKLNPKASSAG